MGNVSSETGTGLAIAGATVDVVNTSLSGTTDTSGDYTIDNVPVETYTVIASATGYNDESLIDVIVSEDTTTVVNFILTPETTSSNTMHVESIVMSLKEAGINVNTIAKVTIFDASNNPVEGATVSGHWSGATTDTDSGITDIYGQVSLESDKVRNLEGETPFTFTVDDVTKEGWTYDSSGQTSNSITY